MVQFLTTIIEWLAIIAFSLVGIDYTPAAGCSASEAASFKPASIHVTTIDDGDYAYLIESDSSDCNTAGSLLRIEDTPVLLDRNAPIDG